LAVKPEIQQRRAMTQTNGPFHDPKKPQAMTLVIDRNLTIVWADPAALAYFGRDIVDHPCHEIVGASREPCARCVVRECFDDRQSHVSETAVRTRSHRRRVLRRTARPAEFRSDGILQYVKEIIEDVTPHRIFEKTMREMERDVISKDGQHFLNALVPRIGRIFKAHMVFIGTFNPDHTTVQSVATAVRAELAANFEYPLGPAPCRLLLDRMLQLFPSQVSARFPQCDWLTEKDISGYLGVQLRTGRGPPWGLLVALFQKEIEDTDLAEALITLFARPAAVALEQVLNQRILDKYRHIAATSNDQLALLDGDYRYQVVNRAYAAFHNLPVEHIVGRPMPEVVGPEFFNATIRPVAEACLQGRQGRLQIWHPPDGSSSRCLNMAFYPHYEKGANRIKGFVLCAKDITRSKKLEADLRQAAKMEAIGRLAGGIVHDFNNILAAVVGYTDLALIIVKGQPEVAKYLQEIRQAGLRATELVKQILAFSRQNQEVRKPFQPKVILKEALSLLRSTIPANIQIRTALRSEAYILADPIHLHQVVINLCTNAQHAMRDHGGTFSVELEDVVLSPAEAEQHPGLRAGPCIRMSFSDTGSGIPAEIQAKMFDPFFTTKAKGEGTGMGLTMVDSIVKSYHGRIDLDSEVGHGTSIAILLPSVEAEREPKREAHGRLAQGGSQSILVVDDERNTANVTGAMLNRLGYKVRIETDSRSALSLFRSNPQAFDLMLCDVGMPGMSGDLLARRVLDLRPDMRIILMTGHSDRVDQKLIEKIGVTKLLSKPLPLNELAASVREVLEKVRA
jgi:PAS domain S-box-containing protein